MMCKLKRRLDVRLDTIELKSFKRLKSSLQESFITYITIYTFL